MRFFSLTTELTRAAGCMPSQLSICIPVLEYTVPYGSPHNYLCFHVFMFDSIFAFGSKTGLCFGTASLGMLQPNETPVLETHRFYCHILAIFRFMLLLCS